MIVGYIHVCQKGEWIRSFQMLMNKIKASGLYEKTSVIRVGIVNNEKNVLDSELFDDDKFEVFYFGKASKYERPTLLHMRKKTRDDAEDTVYYYLHTKGIKHFGSKNEQCVIDWINLLLYWNVERWETAVEKLKTYDT